MVRSWFPFLRHNGDAFFPNPFRDYVWAGAIMGMSLETDTDDIEAYCPGVDGAINCHPALINVGTMTPRYDDAGVRRHLDPGVGSFTPYHNGTTTVVRPIPAGGELFKQYGHHWFDTRAHSLGAIPMEEDYQAAQALLQTMTSLSGIKDGKEEVFYDLYNILLRWKQYRGPRDRRALDALPDQASAAWKAVLDEDGDVTKAVHQPTAIRSLDYLQKHGRCIDNIRPARSNTRQAAHGAVATRPLPAGTIITTSPLHHLPDRNVCNLYNFTTSEDGEEWIRVQDQIVGQQVLLNYCFSHPQSTVLLCPYGSGINYINHAPSPYRVNVQIRWARDFPASGHNDSVLHEPLSYLASTEQPILAVDYVATRDIAQGDELFLDYGPAWEEAWRQHVASYQPYPDQATARSYKHGRFWNNYFANSVLRTEEEQEFDPYPSNLDIRCHTGLVNYHQSVRDDPVWSDQDVGIPCRILHRINKAELIQDDGEHGDHATDDHDQFVYTVELEHGDATQITRAIRPNVPRHWIAFFDVPLSTDLRLPNAFRHWIGLPDHMLPEQWKNIPEGMPDPFSIVYQQLVEKRPLWANDDDGDDDHDHDDERDKNDDGDERHEISSNRDDDDDEDDDDDSFNIVHQ